MAKKKGLSRGAKIAIGVAGGFTIAYFVSSRVEASVKRLFGGLGKRDDDVPDPAEEPTEEEPEPGTAREAGGGVTRASTKVPGKVGTMNYNHTMFPNTGAIMGALTGLSPAYSSAQFEETFPATVGSYQADWNTLSEAGLLLPTRLNGTRLDQDEVPGPQMLRALEWSVGMDWPARLNAAGLQL